MHRRLLLHWAAQGRIDTPNVPRAARLAGVLPEPTEWLRFVDRVLLSLGGIFIATGIIFFLAYNWQVLGRYAKFGMVESCLVAAVFVAWRAGLDRIAGKAALLAGTLLLGALLALFGQTYQTGADTYELFATWAVLALPWVLLARFAPLWLLWLVLINVAATLYFTTFPNAFGLLFDSEELLWVLFVINTVALIVWELGRQLMLEWLSGRNEPRVLALASGGAVSTLMLWFIFEQARPAAMIAYFAWLGAGYAFYRHRVGDLFMLALGVLSAIVIITAVLVKSIGDVFDNAGNLLFIALVVIALSAAGGWWLRQRAAEEHV